MSKIALFIPLLFVLLVGCSDDKSATKAAVEPEVEYLSIHALCESPDATPEQVQEFLDLGVDVNAKGGRRRLTPLGTAARNNENPEVISLLLKAGADLSLLPDKDNSR